MMGDIGPTVIIGEKGNTGAPGHPGPKGDAGKSLSALGPGHHVLLLS